MDRNDETRSMKQARFSLSQETITVLTVGVALAGIILVSQGDMRAEARAGRAEARADRAEARTHREALRVEAQAGREALRAEAQAGREALRTEAQAGREALRTEARADREAFAKQITRLVERQGTLSGLVEGVQHTIASSGE